jgi:hypothetical protein
MQHIQPDGLPPSTNKEVFHAQDDHDGYRGFHLEEDPGEDEQADV